MVFPHYFVCVSGRSSSLSHHIAVGILWDLCQRIRPLFYLLIFPLIIFHTLLSSPQFSSHIIIVTMVEPLELDEDIQPLTVTGSSSTASRRHLGDRSSSILRGPITTLLIFASIGAVYILGKEKGQNLRFRTSTNNNDNDGAKMPGKMFVPKTAPVVENAELAMEDDTDTDPPVPTYDPTRIRSTPVGELKLLLYACVLYDML